jgi:hypothetical protein
LTSCRAIPLGIHGWIGFGAARSLVRTENLEKTQQNERLQRERHVAVQEKKYEEAANKFRWRLGLIRGLVAMFCQFEFGRLRPQEPS